MSGELSAGQIIHALEEIINPERIIVRRGEIEMHIACSAPLQFRLSEDRRIGADQRNRIVALCYAKLSEALHQQEQQGVSGEAASIAPEGTQEGSEAQQMEGQVFDWELGQHFSWDAMPEAGGAIDDPDLRSRADLTYARSRRLDPAYHGTPQIQGLPIPDAAFGLDIESLGIQSRIVKALRKHRSIESIGDLLYDIKKQDRHWRADAGGSRWHCWGIGPTAKRILREALSKRYSAHPEEYAAWIACPNIWDGDQNDAESPDIRESPSLW